MMPRTIIEPVDVVPQESVGINFQDADTVNQMMFINDGSCLLVVRNESMDPVDITIVAVADEAGRSVNYVKTMASDTTQAFGPFLPAWWNQTVTNFGFVYVNFPIAIDIKVALINY